MKTKKSVIAVLFAAMIMLIPCSGKIYADECREIPAEKTAISKAADNSEVLETNGEFEGYSVYEKYGLLYDNENDCYTYNGSVVRFSTTRLREQASPTFLRVRLILRLFTTRKTILSA